MGDNLINEICDMAEKIDQKHHEADVTTVYNDANAYSELMEYLFSLKK